MRNDDIRAIMLAFSFRLRDTRTASRLTQDRLARLSGVHHTEISKLERALTDPRLSTIVRLARGLDVPTSTLVEDRYQEPQLTIDLAPGERTLTPEEFEGQFGHLPADGEG